MQGTILSARVETVEYIRFVGIIRYSHCVGLEAHINQMFDQFDFSEIAIDLEHAEMLDSTALGLLARISIEFAKRSNKKPVIFLLNGELAHILKRVCFDQVFNIIAKSNDAENLEFVELASVQKNEEEVLACVVEAHRSLAEISDDNKCYFTDITKALG